MCFHRPFVVVGMTAVMYFGHNNAGIPGPAEGKVSECGWVRDAAWPSSCLSAHRGRHRHTWANAIYYGVPS